MFIKLASKSLLNRKGSVLLSLLAMTVSLFVLLGVEHIRYQAKESFSKTISGVDLIVGARTGSLNLLLYSVFRVGSPTNNIQWQTYEAIVDDPQIKWAIPMSLGDSHRGYRVLGTTNDYFKYFSYGNKHQLEFVEGRVLGEVFDVVLGAEVAKQLGYTLGDRITLAHGIATTSFTQHDEYPFTVVGVLAPTGTPVDQTLHVSLQGIEAIHIDWRQGVQGAANDISNIPKERLEPQNITAFMLGLNSKIATFQVQKRINDYQQEPLLAILPGVVFSELWQMMAVLEHTLRLVSVLVLLAALLGLSALLLSSIRERGHEIQLLRVIGAPAWFLFVLIELEALLITALSIVFGSGLLWVFLIFSEDFLMTEFGLFLEKNIFHLNNVYIILVAIAVAILAAAIPSLRAYKVAQKS